LKREGVFAWATESTRCSNKLPVQKQAAVRDVEGPIIFQTANHYHDPDLRNIVTDHGDTGCMPEYTNVGPNSLFDVSFVFE